MTMSAAVWCPDKTTTEDRLDGHETATPRSNVTISFALRSSR